MKSKSDHAQCLKPRLPKIRLRNRTSGTAIEQYLDFILLFITQTLSIMAVRIPFNYSFWQEHLSCQVSSLPYLDDIRPLTERVVRIMGGNPGNMKLQGTNTYLIGTGKSRILIDTGEGAPRWIETISRFLEQNQIEISHVLLTHWHGDHTGGVPDLVAYDQKLACRVYKNQPDYGQNDISEGQRFRVEGATLRAVFSPGHAVDHMCFVLEEENALFTGDNVLGHGFSVVQDLGTYMNTLEKMAAENCVAGYPAHGAKIQDLPAKMKEYISHKEFRVRQVFSTLERNKAKLQSLGRPGKGGMTLEEIVKSIYGTVSEDVFANALAPFLTQVLWKLAEDYKVGFETGDASKRRWFVKAANVS
ncbi:hypothetical protein DV738_g1193, partial [Chaetothyriales sp. CBS 135597]